MKIVVLFFLLILMSPAFSNAGDKNISFHSDKESGQAYSAGPQDAIQEENSSDTKQDNSTKDSNSNASEAPAATPKTTATEPEKETDAGNSSGTKENSDKKSENSSVSGSDSNKANIENNVSKEENTKERISEGNSENKEEKKETVSSTENAIATEEKLTENGKENSTSANEEKENSLKEEQKEKKDSSDKNKNTDAKKQNAAEKPASASAKTKSSAAAKNGKTETTAEKKQAEKTKPRKYTDDRWVLKISSEAVKEAVENKPAIRGVHITAWVAGSTPLRTQIINNIKKTVLNTVVIALKEMDGAVYIKGVEKAEKYKAYAGAIPNPEKMVEDFKKEGLYTVGRIVLFKDDILPVRRPDLSVKTPEGNIWRDRKGKTWADQYSKEVWDYNIAVALRAVEAGFDEIQFDYIRYPSEGKVSLCRYSVPHNWDKARANLAEFLRYAREKIPEQIRISADVFGLTTSARDDMGIGQNLPLIAQYADYVYPMMYPSHYYPGHYGLKNPNAEPYKVINFGLRDAMARLELNYAKLRPYLQDFSKYGPHEVGEQIRALRKNLLHSWVLWSPNNKYTWSALYPDYYKKNIDPTYVPDK